MGNDSRKDGDKSRIEYFGERIKDRALLTLHIQNSRVR